MFGWNSSSKNESYSCIYTYGHVGLWRIAVTQRDGSESRTKTPIEGLGFSFAVSEIPKGSSRMQRE